MIDLYVKFVRERHQIWTRRMLSLPAPWTDDPVLRTRKFTHMFRQLDTGTQFLIRELLDPDLSPRDTLMRCFLYRYTNRPETWQALDSYPREADLYDDDLILRIQHYRDSGNKVFSGAYMILPQPNRPGDKVRQAVELTARWMRFRADQFLEAKTQEQRYEILRAEYGVGPFLAMQILTDWGYSVHVGENRENEFVVAGPGARVGARHIDPAMRPEQVIEKMTSYWSEDDSVTVPGIGTLSLMNTQNTFCEFGKYVRWIGKPVSRNDYTGNGPLPDPVLPFWKGTENGIHIPNRK